MIRARFHTARVNSGDDGPSVVRLNQTSVPPDVGGFDFIGSVHVSKKVEHRHQLPTDQSWAAVGDHPPLEPVHCAGSETG